MVDLALPGQRLDDVRRCSAEHGGGARSGGASKRVQKHIAKLVSGSSSRQDGSPAFTRLSGEGCYLRSVSNHGRRKCIFDGSTSPM